MSWLLTGLSIFGKALAGRGASKVLGLLNNVTGASLVVLAIVGYIIKEKYTITLDTSTILLIVLAGWAYVNANRRAAPPGQ